MKRITLLIIALAFVISTFSACKNSTTTESSSESATSKVVAITTTSEKESETSSAVSETQSQIETSPESVNEKKLNLDLLSDIGLTYEEIKKRRGNLTDAYFEGGGIIYVFENGYGGHSWADIDLKGVSYPIPTDENNVMSPDDSPLPKAQAECGGLWYVQAKDLFIGLDQPATTSEIEKNYNIEHFKPEDAEIYGYGTNFTYEDKFICIMAEKEGIVTPDSYLWIKPISDTF